MYIVKRPFKNLGIVYTAGTVITEPATIKRFKGKLAEGKIIKVTEQTFEATAQYFKAKYNVDLKSVDTTEETKSEAKVEEPVKVTTKAKPATAKATVKVTKATSKA